MTVELINEQMKTWLPSLREYIVSNTDYKINEKLDFRDLVSEVDVAVERKLTEYIQSLPGDHVILGEETNNDVDLNADNLWVIDPIDGTSNFIKQADDYGILVAYFKKGVPTLSYMYEVETNTLLVAQKGHGVTINGELADAPANVRLNEALISMNPRKMSGTDLLDYLAHHAFDIRFLGSSISDALRVFTGKYGAFVSPESMPWDRAPYMLIAKEFGLHMSKFNGEKSTIHGDENFFIGTKAVYNDLFGEHSTYNKND